MAKKTVRGARSQAIREYLAKNPAAGVKVIVEELAKQGIKVSAALVGAIKYTKGKKAKRKKIRAAAASEGLDIKQLVAVKRLVNELGGIDQLRNALAALEKLA